MTILAKLNVVDETIEKVEAISGFVGVVGIWAAPDMRNLLDALN